MTEFFSFLQLAVYVSFLHNLVFISSYGISEAVRLAKRPKHFFTTGLSVTAFSVYLSVTCHFADKISFLGNLSFSFRFLLYVLILLSGYLASATVMKKLFGADKKFLNSLGMCAVNTLVLALPTFSYQGSLSLSEAFGLGIGAGAAFTVSLLLINGGMKLIHHNRLIPEFMKGTPALFIYTALLSLALSAVTGDF